MLKINLGHIELTRGGDYTISVNITDKLGRPYEMTEDDKLVLSVRKYPSDGDNYNNPLIIHKIIVGSNQIHLEPTDTLNIEPDDYLYDVKLLRGKSNKPDWVVDPHRFIVYPSIS